jgi:surfactin synthase thioesterase subunit
LPGRERRIAEPLGVDPAAIAAAMHVDAAGRPYALFGHSMGGLLAFDLARRLTHEHRGGPAHLAISAIVHPKALQDLTPISHLPDDELLAWVRRLGGAPEAVLEDPQLLELLLAPLRCDSAWMERYLYRQTGALSCDISVFDAHESDDDLSGWASETTGGCVERHYPGGHFYLVAQANRLLADLLGDLERHRSL